MSRSIWATLGIPATNDTAEIRRAYARRLKAVHPEDDPDGFQTLRAAYDHAIDMARNGWAVPRPPEGAEGDDDDGIDAGGWNDPGARQWTVGSAAFDGGAPTPIDARWGPPGETAPPPPGAADE
ncbi:J domain-containing protein, partial [Brevundimonas sp. UBA7664]|uniref:J domain-containing protein n=1 Tax=Brevundimonas sp. UBA7664 TaxID=1946141 RepID=UPI0025BE4E5A